MPLICTLQALEQQYKARYLAILYYCYCNKKLLKSMEDTTIINNIKKPNLIHQESALSVPTYTFSGLCSVIS